MTTYPKFHLYKTFYNVVEAYRLERYDNQFFHVVVVIPRVVEAYRLERYDNFGANEFNGVFSRCRSLSLGKV